MLGPIIGWGIVIVPLALVLSWMVMSVRLLRFTGWLFAGAAAAAAISPRAWQPWSIDRHQGRLGTAGLVRPREMGCIHRRADTRARFADLSTIALRPKRPQEGA